MVIKVGIPIYNNSFYILYIIIAIDYHEKVGIPDISVPPQQQFFRNSGSNIDIL